MVQMLGSLYDSIENDYGAFPTRLYRAFRPKSGDHVKYFIYTLCTVPVINIVYCCCNDDVIVSATQQRSYDGLGMYQMWIK